jgi:ribosomal protein S18 acetylase RimI-like enzyme
MNIIRAKAEHIIYAKAISKCIDESAKSRGTGIARRTPEYIHTKMTNGNGIIALDNDKFAGFCYIEVWGHGKYVAHSGLIVAPDYRGQGLAKKN